MDTQYIQRGKATMRRLLNTLLTSSAWSRQLSLKDLECVAVHRAATMMARLTRLDCRENPLGAIGWHRNAGTGWKGFHMLPRTVWTSCLAL
ncbi:hypothetical protein C798_00120 [Herbaspirillum rubrisubalbicans Os34]|uniref:Uncharacterized protein n=1 Tax=Herbaspirillum rubrisubalbicans Os34 TaxID=1235827 RepID=A0A6M3ZJA2_9BURK|nr:hypothetical protein C798_00120 [Herbaspirillum rubrisubalbicans Os34]